jgi:hypothetical protein
MIEVTASNTNHASSTRIAAVWPALAVPHSILYLPSPLDKKSTSRLDSQLAR